MSKNMSLKMIFLFSAGLFCFTSNLWALGWRHPKVVSPDGEVKKIEWEEWEKMKDPVKRDIAKTNDASFHIIRLQGMEPAHTHDTHDLVAVVLKGMGKIHYGETIYDIQKGDIVHIPRGVPHWVENTGNQSLEAYAIFNPPFDGKDFHLISGRQREESYSSR